MTPRIICLSLLLLAAPALAAAAGEGSRATMVQGPLLQTVLGLGVVVVLILGLAWLLRHVLRLQPTMHGQLRVLGGLSLGPRERVVLLKVGDTQLVVGTTPGRIQTLHVLERPLPEDEPAGGAAQGRFAAHLAQALGRRKTPGDHP